MKNQVRARLNSQRTGRPERHVIPRYNEQQGPGSIFHGTPWSLDSSQKKPECNMAPASCRSTEQSVCSGEVLWRARFSQTACHEAEESTRHDPARLELRHSARRYLHRKPLIHGVRNEFSKNTSQYNTPARRRWTTFAESTFRSQPDRTRRHEYKTGPKLPHLTVKFKGLGGHMP
mmetsp:Transcript_24814/g.65154  ORF Transcript_24814/g.65154 Transcript_24814/m.65154 type:complete len:175 (+) Transcript_24814:200-724(+)